MNLKPILPPLDDATASSVTRSVRAMSIASITARQLRWTLDFADLSVNVKCGRKKSSHEGCFF
jgi:hypothetical protein